MNAIVKFNINSLVGRRDISKQDTQKGLVTLAKNSDRLADILHALSYSALRHTAEAGNGDASLLDQVIPAIGKAGRVEMFKLWVSSFSPYYFDNNTKHFKKAKKGAQSNVAFNLDGAWDKPFFSVDEKKVNDSNAFVDFTDITELAISMLGKLVKRIDGGKIDSKGHVEMVNSLKIQLIALKDSVAVIDRDYKAETAAATNEVQAPVEPESIEA